LTARAREIVDGRYQLERIAAAVAELRRRRNDRPLDYIGWLPGQHAFLSSDSRRKLFRAGNQAHGKTIAGLAAVHFRALGEHPFLEVPPAPIEAWIICASWSQSVAIQEKFWEHVGATGELDAGTAFDAKNGFGAKNPIARYVNGSVVRFKTTQQGSLNLSGATIDCALFDEPPATPRIFSEVQKRLIRRGGALLLTLTPIGAPCDWLREQVEDGHLTETHVRLEPENLIPVGASAPMTLPDGTPMDQAWIDAVIAETLPHEIGVVCHGGWEIRVTERVFSAFAEPDHVTADLPTGEVKIAIGIDYGDGAQFEQVAMLCAIDESGPFPRVWILDENVPDTTTTIDMDAASILGMLERNGMRWSSVDRAYGDRSWSGRHGSLSSKSNADLMAALAKAGGAVRGRGLRPKITTVKRGRGHGRGSVAHGCRFLHAAMVRPGHFHIHPRCTRLIESLNRWDYRENSEWKHAIDGIRYGLDNYIFTTRRRLVAPVRLG